MCARCYWWKRRSDYYGSCWHPTQTGEIRVPEATCDDHTPKVIRVEADTHGE